ncbi:hypothetical protein BdWA1_002711 [Babesia duncani]|uniref:Uncharacterized protein n=1 Tax=Babesia duncani TaxID=323732 RepID=A0AAD9PJR2_9APIC|nr:hypothetical protein BdWA1_002711 [Babesia duncani]
MGSAVAKPASKSPYELLLQLAKLSIESDQTHFDEIWSDILVLDAKNISEPLLELYIDGFILHNLLNRNLLNGLFKNYWLNFSHMLYTISATHTYNSSNNQNSQVQCTEFVFILSNVLVKCMAKRLSFVEILYHLDYVEYFLTNGTKIFNQPDVNLKNPALRLYMVRQNDPIDIYLDFKINCNNLRNKIQNIAKEKWSESLKSNFCLMDSERSLFSIESIVQILPRIKETVTLFIILFEASSTSSCLYQLLESIHFYIVELRIQGEFAQKTKSLMADTLIHFTSSIIRNKYLCGNDKYDVADDLILPIPKSFEWVTKLRKCDLNLAPFNFIMLKKLQHQIMVSNGKDVLQHEKSAHEWTNIIKYAFNDNISPSGILKTLETILPDFDAFTIFTLTTITAREPWAHSFITLWLLFAWSEQDKTRTLTNDTLQKLADVIKPENVNETIENQFLMTMIATCVENEEYCNIIFSQTFLLKAICHYLISNTCTKSNCKGFTKRIQSPSYIVVLYRILIQYFNHTKHGDLVKDDFIGLAENTIEIMQWNLDNHHDQILMDHACMLLKHLDLGNPNIPNQWLESFLPILDLIISQHPKAHVQTYHLKFIMYIKIILCLALKLHTVDVATKNALDTILQNLNIAKKKANSCETLQSVMQHLSLLIQELNRLSGSKNTFRFTLQESFKSRAISKYIQFHIWNTLVDAQPNTLWDKIDQPILLT